LNPDKRTKKVTSLLELILEHSDKHVITSL